ncbi:polysaccharide biosynthesis protein [Lunatimonas lonarensis]|uniref:Polysaccharide biosynthesis protein n=1 Tax=Lunatimonas lonarensis TaxID=1232681 RepID=R7ZV76_9BACT|nr:oligosaccharide flippase family protein [Lunatimonas lonarensis]EON77904.1 polysaccharide biosynthesis protein [Lunatimonas lonarensis]
MSERKYWLTSGFFTMLHRGVDFVLGFAGFMLLVRILSPNDFGVWVLLITITAIVDMARNGFLQNGMIKFLVNQTESNKAKIQMVSLWLNGILTLAFVLLLLLFADTAERIFNAEGLAEIVKIYAYFLPVLILHTHNLVLMQASYDFKAYFFAGISKSLPLFLFIVYFSFNPESLSLTRLAWIQNLTFGLATLMSIYQVKAYFRITPGWHAAWATQIFHFGKFVFGTNLISMLTNSLDKFLLGALLSPVQVALANTAGRVMNMVEIPVNSIASISYPKASEAHDRGQAKEVAGIYVKTLGMMLSITVPFWIANLLLADYIILFIAGEEYLEAVPFLRIVALIALIKPFDRQAGVFLDAIGKPFYNMVMVLGTFVYGALLSYVFIQSFGLMGAAYGLVLALGITAAIKQFILGKFLPIRLLDALFVGITYYPELWKMVRSKLKK